MNGKRRKKGKNGRNEERISNAKSKHTFDKMGGEGSVEDPSHLYLCFRLPFFQCFREFGAAINGCLAYSLILKLFSYLLTNTRTQTYTLVFHLTTNYIDTLNPRLTYCTVA